MLNFLKFPKEREDLGVGLHNLRSEDGQEGCLVADVVTQLEYFPSSLTRRAL